MITDMIGNQVMMTLSVPSTALPHIKAGKLKALAVTGPQRIAPLPDVPTIGESPELRGFQVTTTIAMFAPGKVPAPVIERLSRELAAVLQMPDIRAAMQEQAATPGALAPAAYANVLREDMARYERIVKSANIKAE
jgi:tripartite-type tricarboxylate transporter receptor subunit TctC